MSVLTSSNRIDYTADGVQTVFGFPFNVYTQTDLQVYVTPTGGTSVLQVLNTDYTQTAINIPGGQVGGNVVFASAPTNTYQVTLIRRLPILQQTSFTNLDKFDAKTAIEGTYDKLTMIDQQINEIASRAPILPVNSLLNPIFPLPGASKFIRWNSSGTSLEAVDITGGALNATMDAFNAVNVAGLPAAGQAGRARYLTDSSRGLWIDQGNQFVSVSGEVYNVKFFGAKGDGTTDDTSAIQAAITAATNGGIIYFPLGRYKITSTLTVNGLTQGIALIGAYGYRTIQVGGASNHTASELVWSGAASGTMLQIDSCDGAKVLDLCFSTASGTESTITIDSVIGIKYINKSSMRFATIERCQFWRVSTPIDFLDDGSGGAANTNMDGHRISHNAFLHYRTGILVNQTNVYNTNIYNCAFYGSLTYTQYHVHVVKGHVTVGGSTYFGKLKDGASVGGKNGISVYVENGLCSVGDSYSEADNGPFYVWVAAEPTGVAPTLYNCWILNQTATLPGTYNLLNSTNETITIIGGRIAGSVKQALATTGAIVFMGSEAPAADATGIPDQVQVIGSGLSGVSGMYGVNTTMGTGISTIVGSAPNLLFFSTGTTNSVGVYTGVGSPAGAVIALPGSIYLNRSGGAGTTLYVKEANSDATGWQAK